MAHRAVTVALGVRLRMAAATACLLLALGLTLSPAPAAAQVAADDVRAAFLFNFAKFTEWPAGGFASADEPLVVCFAGGDGVAGAFLRFGQKSVQNRALVVRQGVPVRDAPGCHMLYVDATDVAVTAPYVAATSGHAVLTVSHAPGFAAAGGMIGILQAGDRMQFEVNVDRAAREKVRLSSHVLRLARIVRDGGA